MDSLGNWYRVGKERKTWPTSRDQRVLEKNIGGSGHSACIGCTGEPASRFHAVCTGSIFLRKTKLPGEQDESLGSPLSSSQVL